MRLWHQTRGLREQRGRWLSMWWADGKRKSRVFGLVKDMTKSKVREEVGKIGAEEITKRQAACQAWLFAGRSLDIEVWRMMAVSTRDDAWVFPSKRMTPMSKDNCWNRNIKPKLDKIGMGGVARASRRRATFTFRRSNRVFSPQ